jgi:protein gp37
VLRGRGHETFGPGAPRVRTSADYWQVPRRWNRKAEEFFAVHGRRQRVFVNSLSDVFDNEVDAAWRADLFALIAATPSLDWLLLTKRIGNAQRMIDEALDELAERSRHGLMPFPAPWPWPNVWLMATMVNQQEFDRDIGKLLRTPAAVHGISIEPMLGAMDLRLGGAASPDYADHQPLASLDWVIAGGESGPRARPGNGDWYRSLRDQCEAARVPFLFKQHGEWIDPRDLRRLQGGGMPGFGAYDSCRHDMKTDAVRISKADAGRLLDGVEHNEFPRKAHV